MAQVLADRRLFAQVMTKKLRVECVAPLKENTLEDGTEIAANQRRQLSRRHRG